MDIESRAIKKVKQEQAAMRKTAANIAKEVRDAVALLSREVVMQHRPRFSGLS